MKRFRLLLAVGVAMIAAPALAKTPVPKATLVPATAASYPFGAADHQLKPEPLEKMGYVEEEYFLTGAANVYDWPATGAVVRTPNAPYVTRVLVRRPKSKGKFSGRVVVEMMNPSNLLDLNIGWAIHRDKLMRDGDAWVGVTAKPISVVTLKTFDPVRYAPLSWANPLPTTDPRNCERVGNDSTRQTENGLAWDIFTQLGAWLRSTDPSNPFTYGTRAGAQHPVKHLYAWGYSQTGSFLYTYLNAINPLVIREDGKPMYDGALIAVSGGPGALNQCSGAIPAGDPRRRITNPGMPVLHVMSQSDFAGYALNRRPDSNEPGNQYRDYDIAGAGHATPDELYYGPGPADITKGGRTPPPVGCDQGQRSRFPSKVGFNAVLVALEDWVEKGVPAPAGAVIKVADGRAVLDEHGNAVGGVRSPYMDVPTSTWFGNATGASFCRIAGYEKPFDAAKLKTLYPTKADYVRKVEASVRELVAARYVTREDGAEIVREARAFAWPK